MYRLIFISIIISLILISCSEEDVFTVGAGDEVVRLINESYDGQELFMTYGFTFPDEPYSFPGNDTSYLDVVDSIVRTEITYNIPTRYMVILQYGVYNFAEATIKDVIYITRTKSIGSYSATSSHSQTLTKKAFLIKLGDDNQKYSGWSIAGVSYIDDIQATTVTNNGKTIKYGNKISSKYNILHFTSEVGDFNHTDTLYNETYDYYPTDSIYSINLNSISNVTVNIDSLDWLVYINYFSSNGLITRKLTTATPGTSNFVDTFTAQRYNDQYWYQLNLSGISKINDSTGLYIYYHNWFVPYRISN